jgi:hypothetical protein
MQNKDLLWANPDYSPGKAVAEKPARKRGRKPSKDEFFIDDGKQTTFTVAQIASLWQYSIDTVQRMFADEPGVQVIGNKNPRGKRRRVTLRIPREVMDRVKRRLSNR